MSLKELSKPVEQDLKEFNKFFKEQMKTNVSLLNLIIQYMTRKRGKQVRPTLVFLSALLCGDISRRSYTGAAMIELLHTATLIHDDVVDEASERRGMASINATWNNKIAVLIGDFLLSKGLLASIDKGEFDFLRATSHAVRRMSEGELLQIQKSREIDIDEETYFKIISDKTASLMASCCEIGAISATDDKDTHMKMRQFGEYLGIAFQIKDDIMDYQSRSSIIGKPVGNDLKEKKLTLPLIHAFTNVSKSETKRIVRIIKSGGMSRKAINEVIDFARENGGITYSEVKALEYSRKAIDLINDFPDSEAKQSLEGIARFVVERNM
jgi:octaprenyl-diphosphate synthase